MTGTPFDAGTPFDEKAARRYIRDHANDTTMEGMAFVRKLLAHRDAEIRKNERRKKKRLSKRLDAAGRIADPEAKAKVFDKIWRSVTPPKPEPLPPKFDRSAEATELRQAKLVDNLFHYATLASAWRMAGYSPTHHSSLGKILSSPFIRAEVIRRLNLGGKLRGKLHQSVIDKIGWHPVRLDDLI